MRLRSFSHPLKHFIPKRALSSSQSAVRVRFAPSPTGHLHLGGLRSALYNYLFAKSRNGTFILRIEDTDQKRVVPEAIDSLQRDLAWIGISIDEGPSSSTGQYGPYVQSERLPLYRNEAKRLLEEGKAYRCFCSTDRLELLRREALKNREQPKYDNKCRGLSAEESESMAQQGQSFVIRFKLQPGLTTFSDMIYEKHEYDTYEREGDTILMKSDGWPTYHFANVVDDHHMQISHVLRGNEWLVSTAKHLQLYAAFGWQPPKFGHLPNLQNLDGSKMSKRRGDVFVDSFRRQGYYPLALINFVCSYGGGFKDFTEKDNTVTTILSLPQLIDRFDIELIHRKAARVQFERLDAINELILRSKPTSELVEELREMVKAKFSYSPETEYVERVLRTLLKERTSVLSQLLGDENAFLWSLPNLEDVKRTEFRRIDDKSQMLKALLDLFVSANEAHFVAGELKVKLKEFAEMNLDLSVLQHFLRSILTGSNKGPPVAQLLEMLGQRMVLQRLKSAAAYFEETVETARIELG